MDISASEKLLEAHGEKFEKFRELLLKFNAMFNLTAITDGEGIKYRHFIDSIAPEKFFPEGSDVVEIGSGGGFPSIPLKIVRDDLKFTLVESSVKKCAYLNEVINGLELKDVRVVCARAEDFARSEGREKFSVVCARAVAPLNTLAEYCLPLIKKGGIMLAYKGECSEEIKKAQRAFSVLGGKLERVEKYELANCGSRTLAIVKKVENTPEKYPRGQGKERKYPL